jgi:hypothetical protein
MKAIWKILDLNVVDIEFWLIFVIGNLIKLQKNLKGKNSWLTKSDFSNSTQIRPSGLQLKINSKVWQQNFNGNWSGL